MKFTVWLSKKMRFGENTRRSGGVIIAEIGVAVAIAVLEISVATVSGFKEEISRKVIGFDSELAVYPPSDSENAQLQSYIYNPELLRPELEKNYPGAEVTGNLRQPALIKTDTNFAALILNGYDKTSEGVFGDLMILSGELPDFSSTSSDSMIAISSSTASKLGLKVGEKAILSFFTDGEIKLRRPTIAAIYTSNMNDFDAISGYTSARFLRKVADLPEGTVSRVEIRGLNEDSYSPEDITANAEALQNQYINDYYSGKKDKLYIVDSAVRAGGIYFNWLSLLDTNVVVIIILMLFIAGFTLASGIFMVVLERIKAIGTLRSLGCSYNQLRSSLSMLGMRIVIRGLTWGNIAGIGLITIQYLTHLLPLNPEMYYLNYVPVSISLVSFISINAGALALSWLIIWIPSYFAARIDPIKTLNYD